MFRATFVRSLLPFCNRRVEIGGDNDDDDEKIRKKRNNNNEIDEFYAHHIVRIGWWPPNLSSSSSERDRELIEALGAGRFELIGKTDRDIDWAYAAVSLGPLRTEIVRWHFPTSRWYRMPSSSRNTINDQHSSGDQVDWCIYWRPPGASRPPGDRVSPVSAGPFRSWRVLAGEVATSCSSPPAEYSASVVLQTTRSSNHHQRSNNGSSSSSVFSLILITDHGRNKQGFLLSPSPTVGEESHQKSTDHQSEATDSTTTTLVYYLSAYQRDRQQLYLFAYDNNQEQQSDVIWWYRYAKRGRRVYWLYGKQKIQLLHNQPTAGLRRRIRGGFRNGYTKSYHLVITDSSRNEQYEVVSISLDSSESQPSGIPIGSGEDSKSDYCYDPPPPDTLIELGGGTTTTRVPILVKFNTPFSLRTLSARATCSNIHPKYLNSPQSLTNALPQNRLVMHAIRENVVVTTMMIR